MDSYENEATLENIDLDDNETSDVDIRYDMDENHPLTTKKELWGFYLYEASVQPYSRFENDIIKPNFIILINLFN